MGITELPYWGQASQVGRHSQHREELGEYATFLLLASLIMLAYQGCGTSNTSLNTTDLLLAGFTGEGSVGLRHALDGIEIPRDLSLDSFDTTDWETVPFKYPRINSGQYEIINGRVLIAFKDSPTLPEVTPNYFDIERPDTDPVYNQITYNYTMTSTVEGQTMLNDPAIAAFIAAEDLEVYSEWLVVAGWRRCYLRIKQS